MAGSGDKSPTVTRAFEARGFDQVAPAYEGMDVELLPLESSAGAIDLHAVSSGAYSVLRQPADGAFHAEGAASEGRVSLILVARTDGRARYNGEALPGNSVILYGPGAVHSGSGAGKRELLSISFPEAAFQERLEALSQRSSPELHGNRLLLTLSPSASSRLERVLRRPLFIQKAGRGTLEAGRELQQTTVPEVVTLVADALESPTSSGLSSAAGRSLFHDARDFLHANHAQPLSLVDVCRAVDASAESVRLAFQQYASVPPMRYLRNVRLARCRRELDSDSDDLVKTVALRHGFRELGRFSAAFREAYGRLPSESRRRTGGR